jgi:hypothetical protein
VEPPLNTTQSLREENSNQQIIESEPAKSQVPNNLIPPHKKDDNYDKTDGRKPDDDVNIGDNVGNVKLSPRETLRKVLARRKVSTNKTSKNVDNVDKEINASGLFNEHIETGNSDVNNQQVAAPNNSTPPRKGPGGDDQIGLKPGGDDQIGLKPGDDDQSGLKPGGDGDDVPDDYGDGYHDDEYDDDGNDVGDDDGNNDGNDVGNGDVLPDGDDGGDDEIVAKDIGDDSSLTSVEMVNEAINTLDTYDEYEVEKIKEINKISGLLVSTITGIKDILFKVPNRQHKSGRYNSLKYGSILFSELLESLFSIINDTQNNLQNAYIMDMGLSITNEINQDKLREFIDNVNMQKLQKLNSDIHIFRTLLGKKGMEDLRINSILTLQSQVIDMMTLTGKKPRLLVKDIGTNQLKGGVISLLSSIGIKLGYPGTKPVTQSQNDYQNKMKKFNSKTSSYHNNLTEETKGHYEELILYLNIYSKRLDYLVENMPYIINTDEVLNLENEILKKLLI